MYYYNNTTHGFYVDHIHGTNIPEGSIPISDNEYETLLAGQTEGNTITVQNGIVVAVPYIQTLSQEAADEYILQLFREQRNLLLTEVDKYQLVLRYNSLTPTQQTELANYRTELLDSTISMVLPVKPIWLV